MNWTTRLLAGATLIWLGLLICGKAYASMTASPPADPPNNPPSIEAIREIAHLIALEVEATEIVATSIKGYTGSTSVVVLVHGTVSYGVDLDKARYVQTDPETRHLGLALPGPVVRQAAIDPDASRVLNCKRSGLWQLAIGPAREDEALISALAIGRDQLVHNASRDDLVNQSRRHAEAVLVQFVSEMDWMLEVHWDR